MMYLQLLSAILMFAEPTTAPADEESLVTNGNFEGGVNGWIGKDNGMSQVKPEAAHGGQLGLRVSDESADKGSSFGSRPVPATVGRTYLVRAWAREMSGSGGAIHIQFFDASGKQLTKLELKNDILVKIKGGEWKQYTLRGTAPAETAKVRVWIHTLTPSKTIVDVDDVSLVEAK
ncbi:MAG: carbohydrate binding domain-containing protein [Anaerolineae bacterium]|nr:carbohydrate binding domain-containing protein [Phycisphaerae bacterium]